MGTQVWLKEIRQEFENFCGLIWAIIMRLEGVKKMIFDILVFSRHPNLTPSSKILLLTAQCHLATKSSHSSFRLFWTSFEALFSCEKILWFGRSKADSILKMFRRKRPSKNSLERFLYEVSKNVQHKSCLIKTAEKNIFQGNRKNHNIGILADRR